AYVEKTILQVWMTGLRLRHDEGVIVARDFSPFFRLLARNVDRALACEVHMIEVEHFVVECLSRGFRKRNQPHRRIKRRQPTGGFYSMLQMLEIDLDVLAA